MILKIAQAELRHLFYSPIAWLIMIAFYVLCGYQFVNPLVELARVQEANIKYNPAFLFPDPISISLFGGATEYLLQHLYLFIPLLTMGIVNREVSSGSLKLLYSSPIRTRDIVFGKYLGLFVFSFVLVLIIAILFTTGYFTIIHAEFSWYLSILLAIFLLVNSYIAIGIFMSSLTSYQLVAAILTFMVFFILQYVGGIWQDYDFFRDITYFLTMNNKAHIMIKGLITSRDVLYFVLITGTFLGFAIIRMKSTQESRSWRVSFLRYLGLFIIMILLGYFSSRPGYVAYVDVTRHQINTIHPNVQDVFQQLDGSPLTVTLYVNILNKGILMGIPRKRNNYVWDYWEMFGRSYPNIQLKYKYYYDDHEDKPVTMLQHFKGKSIHQVAVICADLLEEDVTRYQPPAEIRKQIDLSEEDYPMILELEYKNKKAYARTYPDDKVVPDQEHIAATILRLIDTTPKVVFTTGHFERSPNSNGERGFARNFNDKSIRGSYINNGVDTDTISLIQSDIAENTAVLVVADPKTQYNEQELRKIATYLKNGGNAFILGEPGKQAIINELLTGTGVRMEDGIIVEPKKSYTPDKIPLSATHQYGLMSDIQEMYSYRASGSKYGYENGTVTQSAGHLSYNEINGFKVEPIYTYNTRKFAWLENGVYVSDSAAPVYSWQEGDVSKSSFVVGVQLTRTINNKEQRIVICADADYMGNKESVALVSDPVISWLLYNKYPVYLPGKEPIDKKVTIGFNGARVLYLTYVYVIPGLLLVTGVVILIRRKRK